jgi:hypothetical protein
MLDEGGPDLRLEEGEGGLVLCLVVGTMKRQGAKSECGGLKQSLGGASHGE